MLTAGGALRPPFKERQRLFQISFIHFRYLSCRRFRFCGVVKVKLNTAVHTAYIITDSVRYILVGQLRLRRCVKSLVNLPSAVS